MQYFGSVSQELLKSAEDIKQATAIVKRLTGEVQIGTASKDQLKTAVINLNKIISDSEKLKSKALNGFSDDQFLIKLLIVVILVGLLL